MALFKNKQETVFEISNFLGEHAPQTPLEGSCLQHWPPQYFLKYPPLDYGFLRLYHLILVTFSSHTCILYSMVYLNIFKQMVYTVFIQFKLGILCLFVQAQFDASELITQREVVSISNPVDMKLVLSQMVYQLFHILYIVLHLLRQESLPSHISQSPERTTVIRLAGSIPRQTFFFKVPCFVPCH